MPGYDGTGPLEGGPRTGGGWGRCRRPADESAPMEDPYRYYGIGWGYSPWPEDDGCPDGGERQREPFLMRRMDELIAALDRVKELLSKHSPAEGQDRR